MQIYAITHKSNDGIVIIITVNRLCKYFSFFFFVLSTIIYNSTIS